MKPQPPGADPLAAEYRELRDDERYSSTVQISSIAALVTLHAAIFALFAQDDGKAYLGLPDAVKAIVPLVSFGFTGVFVYRGLQDTVRSLYIRRVETELSRRQAASVTIGMSDLGPIEVALPAGSLLLQTVSSPRSPLRAMRLLSVTGYGIYFSIVVGVAAYSTLNIESWRIQGAAALAYSVMTLTVLRLGWLGTFGGDRLMMLVAQGVTARRNRPLPQLATGAHQPRLWHYLLLPRVPEFLLKGCLIGLISLGVGALADAGRLTLTPTVAVGWLVGFELLMYQARYAVNDLLGAMSESRNPWAAQRGRLTNLDSTARALVVGDAALRLVLAALLGLWLPQFRWPLLVFGTLLAAVTVTYEWARSEAYGEQEPAPPRSWRARDSGLLTVLASGYVLRTSGAFYLLTGDVTGTVTTAMFMFPLAAMCMYMSWVNTAATFLPNSFDPAAPNKTAHPAAKRYPHALAAAVHSKLLAPDYRLSSRVRLDRLPATKVFAERKPEGALAWLATMGALGAVPCGWAWSVPNNGDPFLQLLPVVGAAAIALTVGLRGNARLAGIGVVLLEVTGASAWAGTRGALAVAPSALVVSFLTGFYGASVRDNALFRGRLREVAASAATSVRSASQAITSALGQPVGR